MRVGWARDSTGAGWDGMEGLTDTVQYRFVAALSFHSFSFLASLLPCFFPRSSTFDVRSMFDGKNGMSH